MANLLEFDARMRLDVSSIRDHEVFRAAVVFRGIRLPCALPVRDANSKGGVTEYLVGGIVTVFVAVVCIMLFFV